MDGSSGSAGSIRAGEQKMMKDRLAGGPDVLEKLAGGRTT